ncbi:MAG: hypothetical protein GX345_02395 [Clostridiales bacterium]|mgnify:CR=1 FL=1|nr:hypothetical protein [Clostridiales bacterium]
MPYNLVNAENLRQALALWEMRNKIGTPAPDSYRAGEFSDNFVLPDLQYEYRHSFVDDLGEIKLLFRAQIHLPSWRTKSKQEASFTCYKVKKALTDDCGKVLDYKTCGYILTDL